MDKPPPADSTAVITTPRGDATNIMDPAADSATDWGRNAPKGAVTPAIPPELIRLADYRVIRKLGEGAMGAVYLGEHVETGMQVAIKVLSHASQWDAQAVLRFEKEARLLSQVKHPHVVNLVECGHHEGLRYLVLEFVNGIDLQRVLNSIRCLSERLALQIVRDVADALSAAHERGIVHRDIKPGNILLEGAPAADETAEYATLRRIQNENKPIVKLTDFGIARQLEQSASLALTRTGAILGTPYYLAPEQCSESEGITPATDVYSLGATLFEMVTGRPPFVTQDPVKLFGMHCFEDAPDLRKLDPRLSDGIAQLVARALRKAPRDRQADAGHLRDEIDRLLLGDAVDVNVHPLIPAPIGKVFEADWEWDLAADSDALWPLVSNTERINSAVGLPGVEYRNERDEHGVLRKFGSFKLGWATLKWEEHPFEWVHGRRLGVLREFQQGPFQWFLSVVELSPRPMGGTRLKHHVRIATRGMLGRLLAHLEVNVKGSKALDRIYRRIDEVVSGKLQGSPAIDPFQPAATLRKDARARMDRRHDALRGTGTDLECVGALMQFVTEAPSQELARIRPHALARVFNVNKQQMAETCLHACQHGVLELHWDILCPTCRVSSQVADTLGEIDRHTHCEACNLDFETDLQNAVEMIFRVHPELRKADLKTYCIGGPEHAPHVVAQARFEPGESLELDLALDAGSYVLRGPQLPYTTPLVVQSEGGTTQAMITITRGADRALCPPLQAGRQRLIIENKYPHQLLLRIERSVPREDVLSAAEANRMPLFRQLFPNQVVQRDALSSMSACTLLALRITNTMEMFDTHGDQQAQTAIQSFLNEAGGAIESAGGQVARTQDDRLYATFPDSLDALACAVQLLQRHDTDEGKVQPNIRLALHRGTAMATTIQGRVDVQGRAIHQATALLELPHDRALLLSREVGADLDLIDHLWNAGWTVTQISDGTNANTQAFLAQPESGAATTKNARMRPNCSST